jgi:hypothetical protein
MATYQAPPLHPPYWRRLRAKAISFDKFEAGLALAARDVVFLKAAA